MALNDSNLYSSIKKGKRAVSTIHNIKIYVSLLG